MTYNMENIWTGYEFLTHRKINERLYLILEHFGSSRFNIFVLIGDDRIGVIDSGIGAHDKLRAYIEEFIVPDNKKPIINICTHSGPDHCGGSSQFDEVYIGRGEVYVNQGEKPITVIDAWENRAPILDWSISRERCMSDLEHFSQNDQMVLDFCKNHMIPNEKLPNGDSCWKNWHLVKDGEKIELGGITLEAIWVLGHTSGSICWYNREDNYCFIGDVAMRHAGLPPHIFKECLPYYKNIVEILPEDCVLYSGHELARPKSVLIDTMKAIEDIAEGKNLENDIEVQINMPFKLNARLRDKFAKIKRMEHKVGFVTVGYDVPRK